MSRAVLAIILYDISNHVRFFFTCSNFWFQSFLIASGTVRVTVLHCVFVFNKARNAHSFLLVIGVAAH